MLQVNELNKKRIMFSLQNISFHLPKGYIMGLIGPNGAGKTTLINTIVDLLHKDSGEVLFDGMTMEEHEPEIRNGLGVILGDDLYPKKFTAEKYGELYGPLYEGYDQTLYYQYLERFGVVRNKKLKHLSKGTMIKFQLAFALSHNAKLFIFDEPEDGLDEEFRSEFMDILLELIEDGERSVLLSTHITEDLDRVADYITYIKDGKLLFSGEKESICNRFSIVKGEDYKIRLLPKQSVICSEKGQYSSVALVKHSRMYAIDSSYTIEKAKIDDIMYYIEKGRINNVEDFLA